MTTHALRAGRAFAHATLGEHNDLGLKSSLQQAPMQVTARLPGARRRRDSRFFLARTFDGDFWAQALRDDGCLSQPSMFVYSQLARGEAPCTSRDKWQKKYRC